jgi:hypothetical protein
MLVGEKVGMDATGRRAAAQGGGRKFFFRVVLRSGEGRVTVDATQRTVSASMNLDGHIQLVRRARAVRVQNASLPGGACAAGFSGYDLLSHPGLFLSTLD